MGNIPIGISLSMVPERFSEDIWRIAEALVYDWRFNGPRDSTGVNPKIVLEHNDHWDLVERIAKELQDERSRISISP